MRDQYGRMRALKIGTAVLVTATLLAAGLWIYALSHTTLKVVSSSDAVYAADEFQNGEAFSSLQVYMSNNAVPGIVYSSEPLTDENSCRFIVYTLRLKNENLLAAETVECRVVPLDGDILMYSDGDELIIPAGQSRDARFVLLTRSGGGSVRDIRISCYYCGYPGGMTYTYVPQR